MPDKETEPLPAALRRERMVSFIAERGFVRVTDLSEAFGISDVTVRSDLDALDGVKAVRRVRGGAVARRRAGSAGGDGPTDVEPALAEIGTAAADLVAHGASVLLDAGPAGAALARALVARTDLSDVVVITNGLTVALELEAAWPRISVVVTGGTLHPAAHALVDPMAASVLDDVHADVAFVECSGVHAEHGATHIDLAATGMKQRLVASAGRTVALAEGTAIGEVHLGRIAPVGRVSALVTASGADQRALNALKTAGLDIVVVPGTHVPPAPRWGEAGVP